MNIEFDLEAEPFELSPANTCGPECACNHCRAQSRHTSQALEDPELWAELEEDQFELESEEDTNFQVVSRFPRYGRSVAVLPLQERTKIDKVARHLLGGRGTPIRTIRLVGHADLDTPRRPAFEHQVGLARADAVRLALVRALDRLTGSEALPPYPSRFAWELQSAGASRLVVPNPRTELERSRNRRVEIVLLPYHGPVRRAVQETAGAMFGLKTLALPSSLEAKITEFCRRAPNDNVDRCNCVEAVARKAMQLCDSANESDRDARCITPFTRGRCAPPPTLGINILDGKDYQPPIVAPIHACDWRTDCKTKVEKDCVACRALPPGNYLVLKYKPEPLKRMVERLKCLLDRGCVVPVGVLSGTCDDKPDRSCAATEKWRDCWEHWLLVIGYEGNKFLFWDSAQGSAIERKGFPRPKCTVLPDDYCEKKKKKAVKPIPGPFCVSHWFGVLFYDSTNHRFSTARTDDPTIVNSLKVTGPVGEKDPAGFHVEGFQGMNAQKRYQVVSMHPGTVWKAPGTPCRLPK
jgi:outer membrane protein OmpA-like peptidoglycan-associated protein